LQVAGIGELARDLRDGVDARDTLADASEFQFWRNRLARREAAAIRTASKIFT
jgi:hypothetical protein